MIPKPLSEYKVLIGIRNLEYLTIINFKKILRTGICANVRKFYKNLTVIRK
jgi:hypothetical protein